MTFLEMLERYRVECGVSGSAITDVTAVTGEHLRLRNWLQAALLDIQSEGGGLWEFLRAESSHTVPIGGSLLNIAEWAAGAVNKWKIDEFRISAYGDGRALSVPLQYVPYDQFRNGIGLSVTPAAKPLYFTVRRGDTAILVSPQADQVYTLYFDYWSVPVGVDDDADVPVLPAQYHMLPVYRAMIDYGYFEAAPEVLARARERHDEMMFKMKVGYLPGPTWGGPLA
jgi:hypothetical protein